MYTFNLLVELYIYIYIYMYTFNLLVELYIYIYKRSILLGIYCPMMLDHFVINIFFFPYFYGSLVTADLFGN